MNKNAKRWFTGVLGALLVVAGIATSNPTLIASGAAEVGTFLTEE